MAMAARTLWEPADSAFRAMHFSKYGMALSYFFWMKFMFPSMK